MPVSTRPFDISLPTKAAVAAVREVHARTGDRMIATAASRPMPLPLRRDYSGAFTDDVPLTSIYSKR